VIYPEVNAKIIAVESAFQAQMIQLDQAASQKYATEGAASAVSFVTEQCAQMGNSLVQQWGAFFGQIFMKYRDGYVITAQDDNQACGCSVANAPYSQEWYTRIVDDTGDHYKVPPASANKMVKGQQAASTHSAAKRNLLSRR
jgi:hypothetical protein